MMNDDDDGGDDGSDGGGGDVCTACLNLNFCISFVLKLKLSV